MLQDVLYVLFNHCHQRRRCDMSINRAPVLVVHPKEAQYVRISSHERDPDLLLFYLGEELIGILQVSDATNLQCMLLKQLLGGTGTEVVGFPDRVLATAAQVKDVCEI